MLTEGGLMPFWRFRGAARLRTTLVWVSLGFATAAIVACSTQERTLVAPEQTFPLLAPYPPQALVAVLDSLFQITIVPLSKGELAQLPISRDAAIHAALGSRGVGNPGPNATGEIVWTQTGFVYLAKYSAFRLPAFGGPLPTDAPRPAYLVQVLAQPIPGYPGFNSALVIVDATTGSLVTTVSSCNGPLCNPR